MGFVFFLGLGRRGFVSDGNITKSPNRGITNFLPIRPTERT